MASQTSCNVKEAPDGLYEVAHKLGEGGQCSVWLATYKQNGRQVALKLGSAFETDDAKHMMHEDTLASHYQEWELYKRLRGIAGTPPGLPRVYDFGVIQLKDDDNRELRLRPYMSMQLLGPDLITLMQEGRIGLHSFFQFAERMLTAVQSLHGCGLVHRDIKPGAYFSLVLPACLSEDSEWCCGFRGVTIYADNFCMGKGRHSQDVYLVDLGFAKVYNSRAAIKKFEPFGGTPDYSSASQLRERTTGPADDLESLGYTWLSMLHPGGLPWCFYRDLSEPSTPHSSRVLRQMAQFRERSMREHVDTIPAWLMHWRVLAQSYNCRQSPDYARFWRVLRSARAASACQPEE